MTSVIRKPIRRLVPILRKYYASSCNFERSYTFHYIQKEFENLNLQSKVKVVSTPIRTLSSSNLAKSSDTNGNNPRNGQTKNITDDLEMQSILSEFAKDFNVGSESEQILDEIRKGLDESDSHQTSSADITSDSSQNSKKSNSCLKEKFKEFSDKDSFVIPSYEELQTNEEDYVYHISQEETDLSTIATQMEAKRGIRGVYDIEEIVEVLKKEHMSDIAVIAVPKEMHYADFLVIVTAMSPRHSKAVCERVKKLYKLKKHAKDPFVIVEGENVSEWKVMDMGNIVVHVFLEETRALYDIESLWLFDSAFDRGGNLKDDPLYTAIEQQMAFFNSINENLSEASKPKTT